MKNKFKRKMIVDPKLQLGWAFLVAAIQIPGILLTGFAMSWFYLIYMDNNLTVSCNSSVFISMAVICLILVAIVVIFIAKWTSTITGPIKKIRIILSQMAQGHPPTKPVTFRKGDWFTELGDDLNAMSKTVKQTSQIRSDTRKVLEQMKADLENIEGIRKEDRLQTIDRLMAQI